MKEEKKPSRIVRFFNIKGEKVIRIKADRVLNKNLTTSSKKWLGRHINDEFTQKSKAFGYRARSAFKLIEIQEKFQVVKPYNSVLDLGCAPGGWSEILVKYTQNVIGIDLLETEPLAGAKFLCGDFLDEEVQKQAIALNNGKKFDVIVSDISPNTTGMRTIDHLRIMSVLEIEMKFVLKNLICGGNFATKVFQGAGIDDKIKDLKAIFERVKLFKPKSSRKESKEIYIVCLNFLQNNE